MKKVFYISQWEWEPHIQHNCKLDNLRAGFKIAEGYWIRHGWVANIQRAVGQGALIWQCPVGGWRSWSPRRRNACRNIWDWTDRPWATAPSVWRLVLTPAIQFRQLSSCDSIRSAEGKGLSPYRGKLGHQRRSREPLVHNPVPSRVSPTCLVMHVQTYWSTACRELFRWSRWRYFDPKLFKNCFEGVEWQRLVTSNP